MEKVGRAAFPPARRGRLALPVPTSAFSVRRWNPVPHRPGEGLLEDPRLVFVVPPAIDLGMP
jgi:hypothetical protein